MVTRSRQAQKRERERTRYKRKREAEGFLEEKAARERRRRREAKLTTQMKDDEIVQLRARVVEQERRLQVANDTISRLIEGVRRTNDTEQARNEICQGRPGEVVFLPAIISH